MLVVKVELHSAIDGTVREIAHAQIYNDGHSARSDIGHYKGHLEAVDIHTDEVQSWPFEVFNYPRLDVPVWVLIAEAIRESGLELQYD